MKANNVLKVLYHGDEVGTLALTADKKAAFAYSESWLKNGFSISPFSLPLKPQVFVPDKPYFQGLFGVFADSLPDGWGTLLLNRVLKSRGIPVGQVSALDRLAIVGNNGKGALTYEPQTLELEQNFHFSLDELAQQSRQILLTEYNGNLDHLYTLGGTSGGARPKIQTQIDGEEWLIKFPAHVDPPDIGEMEYQYSLCAKECGIEMTETRLFPSGLCKGYFGTKRFDRGKERVHMCTAAALLELDFTQPSLDYHSLMKLTKILTGEDPDDVENMYRRMCFNVFAHNRDDHSKNFAYLYDAENGRWRLSPAYDLTWSRTYYGEHTTSVDGNGRNPGPKELTAVGTAAGLGRKKCRETAREIQDCVESRLKAYL